VMPDGVIVLAATLDGLDSVVTVYVLNPARLDPLRDQPLDALRIPRSGLGIVLQHIADGGPIPIPMNLTARDVIHPNPPPNDPRLVAAAFRYAAGLQIDDQFVQDVHGSGRR
jgi:hypothetical protein